MATEYLPDNPETDVRLIVEVTPTAFTVQQQNKFGNIKTPVNQTLKMALYRDWKNAGEAPIGIVTSPYVLARDDTGLAPGSQHSIVAIVIEAGDGSVLTKFKSQSETFAVPGEPPLVPVKGNAKNSIQNNGALVEWLDPMISFPVGNSRQWNVFADPVKKLFAPARNGEPVVTGWTKLTPWGNSTALYDDIPRWIKRSGHPGVMHIGSRSGTEESVAINVKIRKEALVDGPRNHNTPTAFTSMKGHPNELSGRGPLYIGVSMSGWIGGLNPDGSTTGMMGYCARDDFDWQDLDDPEATHEQRGIWKDGYLKEPHDLAFFYPDARRFHFVADTGNKRIVLIDRASGALNPSGWIATTYAGGFERPISCECMDDGTLYVTDELKDGGSVWKVAIDRVVTKVCDIPGAFRVQRYSNGDLAVSSKAGRLYRVNLATGTATAIAFFRLTAWPWIYVDRWGAQGPVDMCYMVLGSGGSGNTDAYSVTPDGTLKYWPLGLGTGRAALGRSNSILEPHGHYPWIFEGHPEQATFCIQGFADSHPWIMRPTVATDPKHYDHSLLATGAALIRRGTVQGFPRYSRPSFTTQIAADGHSMVGPSVDDLAELPFAEVAAWFQRGGNGVYPRPEITGYDLRAVLYWTYRNSMRFMQPGGDKLIADLLAAYPVPPASPAPVISAVLAVRTDDSVTVSWLTDTSTICFVAFGISPTYHRYSPIEGSYGVTHQVTLTQVHEGPVHYSIRARDLAGNLTVGPDNNCVCQFVPLDQAPE